MPDIIQLLPDSVANQIAAGEVVQRPASAVKELLENSIDSGATEISLMIKNAGKSLIQVIDNGSGMSETDARLSLERHATSKIKKVEDLFSLRTMGFRGEAVPSIAAVSQMEIRSKKKETELGTAIVVEGSDVKSQEVTQCPAGTNISVKNLFYNIPARRNFLKSNPVETKHIMEEFLRVALIHPEVKMNMNNEGNEVYQLAKGSFRQRIVSIFGDKYNQRLVPVEEKTEIVAISGFIGKPEFAKKSRGEQYFFVNQRFIKSAYLNHAIQNAYSELLAKDQFPSYFLKLEIDPAKIDINIHPTKTEIKFEEERSIYAIIRTAVRQSLGKYNISPTLDFEREKTFDVPMLKKGEAIRMPTIKVDPDYNPFESERKRPQPEIGFPSHRSKNTDRDWQKLYQGQPSSQAIDPNSQTQAFKTDEKVDSTFDNRPVKFMQLHNKYIISQIKSGIVIIDQARAHQRILIDQLISKAAEKKSGSQQLLFPQDLALNSEEALILNSLLDKLIVIGFDIRSFGKNHFIIHGVPIEAIKKDPTELIEELLSTFQSNQMSPKNISQEKLIHSLAKSMSIKSGKSLKEAEMANLFDELFACEMPYHLPNRKPILITQSIEEIEKQLNKQ